MAGASGAGSAALGRRIIFFMVVTELLGQSPPISFTIDGLLLCVLPWAVLWFMGYMLDIRMPWQIIRAGE